MGGKFELKIEQLTVESIEDEAKANYLKTHLKSVDFFQTDSFPIAVFEITNVKQVNKEYSHLISGNLQIKDSTRNITLPCNFTYLKDSISFEFKPFEINRNEWGITYHNAKNESIHEDYLIADEVGFNIKLSLKK